MKLVEDVNANKKLLKTLEDDLLYRLANSTGNLLDDVELIEVLQNTKTTGIEVQEKLVNAAETDKRINVAREEYRPVATRGALLYFLDRGHGGDQQHVHGVAAAVPRALRLLHRQLGQGAARLEAHRQHHRLPHLLRHVLHAARPLRAAQAHLGAHARHEDRERRRPPLGRLHRLPAQGRRRARRQGREGQAARLAARGRVDELHRRQPHGADAARPARLDRAREHQGRVEGVVRPRHARDGQGARVRGAARQVREAARRARDARGPHAALRAGLHHLHARQPLHGLAAPRPGARRRRRRASASHASRCSRWAPTPPAPSSTSPRSARRRC